MPVKLSKTQNDKNQCFDLGPELHFPAVYSIITSLRESLGGGAGMAALNSSAVGGAGNSSS